MRYRLLLSIVMCGHAVAAPVLGQQCAAGRPPAGDIGIRALACAGPGASCAINMAASGEAGPRHEFAVEPVVTMLDAKSDLRVGDTIVAIDSVLITTAAGGRRLAGLRPDEVVALLVRRNGELQTIRVTAGRGCGIRSLTVSR